MADNGGMTLDYEPGKNGQSRFAVRFPDGSSHTDKIDLAKASDREKFVRAATKGKKGLDPATKKELLAEMERAASEALANKPDEGPRRRSQADMLVDMAQGQVQLFHTPGGHDSEGYATVMVSGHAETWPIGSKGFKRWLARMFYLEMEKAPSAQALQDALNVIAGKAVHEGPEMEVAVRLAQTSEAIYLDLADEHWRAVKTTASGWEIVAHPPVKFRRPRGMLPLAAPVAGGKVDLLRPLVNLPDEDSWRLFLAWLVAALRPGRPFPLLVVNGEQGSAKSTLCRMARALVDPNAAALRRPPREDRDLMIAAQNGWVVALDNLSGLAPWFSDALCMLATGGGFSARELYSDGDEKLFDATRPILVNGIEDLATRSDLLDRALTLTLPTIPDAQRQDEETIWRRFDECRPLILGALLDAVAAALRNRPHVHLAEKPRMADFACWAVAAEPALGWPAGSFLAAYLGNRGAANALAVESSIIGPPILALMMDVDPWQGTAADLLEDLEKRADEKTRKRREWPASPRKLAGELRRLAPNLRREDIDVDFDQRDTGRQRRRLIRLERARKTSSGSSEPSGPLDFPGPPTGRYADGTDDGPGLYRPQENPEFSGFSDGADGADGADDVLPAYSGPDDSHGEVVEWTA